MSTKKQTHFLLSRHKSQRSYFFPGNSKLSSLILVLAEDDRGLKEWMLGGWFMLPAVVYFPKEARSSAHRTPRALPRVNTVRYEESSRSSPREWNPATGTRVRVSGACRSFPFAVPSPLDAPRGGQKAREKTTLHKARSLASCGFLRTQCPGTCAEVSERQCRPRAGFLPHSALPSFWAKLVSDQLWCVTSLTLPSFSMCKRNNQQQGATRAGKHVPLQEAPSNPLSTAVAPPSHNALDLS